MCCLGHLIAVSMPPKDTKSRSKKDHRRGGGGPKFVESAEEIESRNAREAAAGKAKTVGSGSEDEEDEEYDEVDMGVRIMPSPLHLLYLCSSMAELAVASAMAHLVL